MYIHLSPSCSPHIHTNTDTTASSSSSQQPRQPQGDDDPSHPCLLAMRYAKHLEGSGRLAGVIPRCVWWGCENDLYMWMDTPTPVHSHIHTHTHTKSHIHPPSPQKHKHTHNLTSALHRSIPPTHKHSKLPLRLRSRGAEGGAPRSHGRALAPVPTRHTVHKIYNMARCYICMYACKDVYIYVYIRSEHVRPHNTHHRSQTNRDASSSSPSFILAPAAAQVRGVI